MEGKTLLRVFMFVSCIGLTALGYRNSNGDNTDAIAAATRSACGSDDCSASLAMPVFMIASPALVVTGLYLLAATVPGLLENGLNSWYDLPSLLR